MYYYIFDPQKLNQKTFERVQNQLYSCLSRYKINGEIARVTSLRTITQLTDISFTRDVKTLIAVGNDETLHDIINAVGDREVTLGYIPVAETELSRIFGLTDIETAAKAIANRRIEYLDLGTVNGNWFITKLNFGGSESNESNTGFWGLFKKNFDMPTFEIKFSADGRYNATLSIIAGSIINARDNTGGDPNLADPTDGFLDVLLVPNISGYSAFTQKKYLQNGNYENITGTSTIHCKKIEITSPEGLPLLSGTKVVARTPAIVEVLPKAVKMIVGKDRSF
jgi:diacylglycerol kinase family enzyme